MLSQNKKTIMITSVVIASTILGGAVNAQQVVSAQQDAVSAESNTVIRDESTFDNRQYRFPPANAVPQFQQQPAPASNKQTSRQNYPMAYPSQRQAPAPYNGSQNRGGQNYGSQNRGPQNYGPQNRGPQNYGPQNRGPQNYSSQNRGAQRAYPPGAMRQGPGARPYGMPYNQNPYNRGPYAQGPYSNPYNRGPYGNPYNRGPYNNNSGPFKNFGMGPFNGDSAPWETWPFGARDSFWSRKELPFKDQNPTDWFQPGDPKEGMAIMWDDLISSPDDIGTMPGGWHVPSVSVPNPVDLEDQLEKASKEVPDLIRVYSD